MRCIAAKHNTYVICHGICGLYCSSNSTNHTRSYLCEPGTVFGTLLTLVALALFLAAEQYGASDGGEVLSVESLLHEGEVVVETLDCVGFIGFPSSDPNASEVEVRRH